MINHRLSIFSFLVASLILAGCATLPKGPSVMVLPGSDKSFEQFQADDAVCRQWAAQQIGTAPQEVANQSTAKSAVAGTVIGAGLGAAIGSASGAAGTGAAIGAASGLLLGSAAGTSAGYASGYEAQRRYDIAYQQCMYAKGNVTPGVVTRTPRRRYPPPPPPLAYNYAPPTPPAAKVIDRLTVHVNFDFDKSKIRKADEADLKKAIDFVRKYPGTKIKVEGYTDSKGTKEYNQKLSERRAEAVRQYLIKEGPVEKAMISAKGYGESRHIAPNKTPDGKDNPEGRAENRRVEILIISD
jgi:outer membrane protein OmpA-like peptidoglycan-associated protein